jgi:hypothetical protein
MLGLGVSFLFVDEQARTTCTTADAFLFFSHPPRPYFLPFPLLLQVAASWTTTRAS